MPLSTDQPRPVTSPLHPSPAFQFNRLDWRETWQTALIAGLSAFVLSLANALDAGHWELGSPIATASLTLLLRALHRWLANNQ